MVLEFQLVDDLGWICLRKGEEESFRDAFNFLFLNWALVLWHTNFWKIIMACLLLYAFLYIALFGNIV